MRLGVRGPLVGSTLKERAELLKRTGYEGIELGQEWLDRPAAEILDDLESTGIAVSAIVGSIQLLSTDRHERERGIALDRERLRMAKELGASAVIEVPTFGGYKFNDLTPLMTPWELERELLIMNLQELIPDVRETGVKLILEPLNRYETHFLRTQAQGADICRAVDSSGFKILSDLFHMHIEEKCIPSAIQEAGPHIGYVHVADSNRQQPGAGFTDFTAAFHALKSVGYDGWIVIESGATGEVETALADSAILLRKLWDAA